MAFTNTAQEAIQHKTQEQFTSLILILLTGTDEPQVQGYTRLKYTLMIFVFVTTCLVGELVIVKLGYMIV